MSVELDPSDDGAGRDASKLLARAAAAQARVGDLPPRVIDDLFSPAPEPIDERTRAAVNAALSGMVAAVEHTMRDHAGQLLRSRNELPLAEALAATPPVLDRLVTSGLVRDPDLVRELVMRARQDVLVAAMPVMSPETADCPSLLPRLGEHADPVVATSALALMVADNRRRAPFDARAARTDLPAELHYRLTWWIAAALRVGHAGQSFALDRALAEAASRCLAMHDEGDRPEAAAGRLAAALDVTGDALSYHLTEALFDRRVGLFVALVAHGIGLADTIVREMVLDCAGDRLWVALRALDQPRDVIAKVGVLLASGDPRRDLDELADALDDIDSLDAKAAYASFAGLRAPADYRAALAVLERPR